MSNLDINNPSVILLAGKLFLEVVMTKSPLITYPECKEVPLLDTAGWMKEVPNTKLLELQPGTFIWTNSHSKDDSRYEEGRLTKMVVTRKSSSMKTLHEPVEHGIQIHISSRKCSIIRFIRDGEPTGVFIITNSEAADEYFANKTHAEPVLRLVAKGGG